MILYLNRFLKNVNKTFGVMHNGSRPLWLTLEPGNLDNQPNISCIPEGVYDCVKINPPKYGITFEIQSVPKRTEILFHSGNFVEDSKGCIILGKGFYSHKDKHGIGQSRDAMNEFRKYFDNISKFNLIII